MTQNKQGKGLIRLGWLTVVVVYIVNLSGFVDTLTGSVTGCGKSWPLCNGAIAPWTWDIHAWIEFGHRSLVFSMTVMVIALAALAWRRYGDNRFIRLWVQLAIIAIAMESFLGALSVFDFNPPALMAAHMGIALLSYGALLALTVTFQQIRRGDSSSTNEAIPNPTRKWAWLLLIYLYIDIYVGAYVSSTGAGGFFRGLLLPRETYSEAGQSLVIDTIHRSFTLGLVIIAARLVQLSYGYRTQLPGYFKGSAAVAALVVLQALSGVYMVHAHLSFVSVLLHVANVSLMYGMVVYLCVQGIHVTRSKRVKVRKTRELSISMSQVMAIIDQQSDPASPTLKR